MNFDQNLRLNQPRYQKMTRIIVRVIDVGYHNVKEEVGPNGPFPVVNTHFRPP